MTRGRELASLILMATDSSPTERLVAALTALEAAAAANVERSRELQHRAGRLRTGLRAGESLVDLVEAEPAPRMVELLSINMAAIESAGAEFRAAEALALRAEGLTLTAIAELFGVTRQRISALVKQRAAVHVEFAGEGETAVE